MDTPVAVTVRAIAAGGAGVADLPDGRVVFVPRTAPGDRARIRISKSRARWAEGSLEALLEPAADRRAPMCALYDRCGGCQLQHLPYESQLAWKARVVADALLRIGRLPDVAPPEVVPSPRETGYRSRMTFTLRRLSGGRVVAGMHALGRPAHVIDVAGECVLPGPVLLEAWRALRSRWGEGARRLPDGGRLRLTLRLEGPGVELVVEGGAAGWSAAELAPAVPEIHTFWHRPADSEGLPELVEGAGEARAAPAFRQVNSEAAALLVRHVSELAGAPGAGGGPHGQGGRAVDAYCGSGAYARALAERGWEVTGIESDPSACAAARDGAPEGFDVREGPVERVLPDALPCDLLILTPPRTGLDADALHAVLARPPARLIYVSCDPATLARDVSSLTDRYRVDGLRCFDLFPQTAHVETVLALRVGSP